MPEVTDHPTLDDFPAHSHDKLRYGDTDRQGHVNNAVFSTLLETGRIEILSEITAELAEAGREWVIARLTLDFLGEVLWPGQVDIGTRVQRVGHDLGRHGAGALPGRPDRGSGRDRHRADGRRDPAAGTALGRRARALRRPSVRLRRAVQVGRARSRRCARPRRRS